MHLAPIRLRLAESLRLSTSESNAMDGYVHCLLALSRLDGSMIVLVYRIVPFEDSTTQRFNDSTVVYNSRNPLFYHSTIVTLYHSTIPRIGDSTILPFNDMTIGMLLFVEPVLCNVIRCDITRVSQWMKCMSYRSRHQLTR